MPASAAISRSAELRAWLRENGFPTYLKADGTFAGSGVRLIHSYQEAEYAFRSLQKAPPALRALERLALHDDPSMVELCLRSHHPAISIQRAVAGVDVNSAFFCWRGQVMATLSMQVVAVRFERGPSTVLRRIQVDAMDRAAEILASQLNLSGFYGLEMNSRATQIPHLALGSGHDLPAAAYAAVTGLPVTPRRAVTTEQMIALFPQEWDATRRAPLFATGITMSRGSRAL